MLRAHQSAQVTTHSQYTVHIHGRLTLNLPSIIPSHLLPLPSPLQLTTTQDPLVVKHFLYTAWPDHGVPQYTVSIHRFIRQDVRPVYNDSSAPLIVHCR